MSITLSALQKQRRDTAANWTAANPTLLAGEIGIESDTEKIKIGDGATAWNSLGYQPWSELSTYPIVNADIASNAEIAVSKLADGTARQLLQTDAAGTGVEWASNIDIPGTLDVTSAATFDNNVIIQGDLTVNGTETIINTQTLDVEDKNIVIGKVVTPSDVTADGGGITLKGTTDKTINWIDATDAWTFSEHVNIVSTKEYRIAGTKVLDATSLGSGVTGSSLTSVGTIGTGTWQGTAINKTYLDATLVSTGDTGTVTSTMILDGTILNADVNASAAIAGTKISPDFGSQTIASTGVFSHPLGAAATPSITFTGDLNTGFWSPSADALAASTAGTERLRITSAGLVGVGTSSPQSLLDVNGLATFVKGSTGGITIGDVSTNSGSVLRLQGTSLGRNWQIANNINVAGIEFTPSTADGGTTFTTPAVAFTSTGRVGIGTSSPANQLQLSTDSAGKPSTNTWTIVSDERIKEEIELADLDLCYEAVKNIPLKRFKWKDEVYTEEQVRDRRKLGWIAQDVEAVFPKAVSTHEFKYNQVFEETIIPAVEEVLDDEGNVTTPAQPERIEKGELISEDAIEDCRDLNSDQLYAAMYGAIQKLMIKVETLETELAALKAP
jgi:hypothetical protein